MPSSSSPHAFRYEPALSTLSEGQTLADWRRADVPRTGKARGRGALRTRVFGPRAAARRLSGR